MSHLKRKKQHDFTLNLSVSHRRLNSVIAENLCKQSKFSNQMLIVTTKPDETLTRAGSDRCFLEASRLVRSRHLSGLSRGLVVTKMFCRGTENHGLFTVVTITLTLQQICNTDVKELGLFVTI